MGGGDKGEDGSVEFEEENDEGFWRFCVEESRDYWKHLLQKLAACR
jgi:hypothetical protein